MNLPVSSTLPLKHSFFIPLLLIAIFSAFFYNIGVVPLFDVDEGAFSQATREMFLRGDFLSTYLNGEPRYDKPILIYWLQAVSVTMFGFTEFSFRLPSALAATVWVAVIFWFTQRLFNTSRALLAALFMATTLAISIIGKTATADALLNLCITATLLTLFLYLHERKAKFLYLSALFAGLGFLTKGPIALAIPAATLLLFCLVQRDLKVLRNIVLNPWAWLIFLAVALPWYVVQYIKEGSGFLESFLFKHNVGRFQQAMDAHNGHVLYYIPVIFIAFLPYTTVLVQVFLSIKIWWKQPLGQFIFIWFGIVFILFSLAATKLPHYIIYGYAGLFVLMAVTADKLTSRWWAFLPQLLLLSTLLVLPLLLPYALPHIRDPFLQDALADSGQFFDVLYYGFLILNVMLLLYCIWDNYWSIYSKLIFNGVLLNIFLAGILLPLVAEIQQNPLKQAALIARDLPQTVVMWGIHKPSFSVYSGKIAALREPQVGDIVLTKSHHLDQFKQFKILYQQRGIALIELK